MFRFYDIGRSVGLGFSAFRVFSMDLGFFLRKPFLTYNPES